MGSNDALLLFKKLMDEGKTVLCSGRLFGVNFAIAGRVVSVADGEVEIVSAKNDCGVRISLLADGLVFEYREPRDFPKFSETLLVESRMAMGLVIEFPDRGGMRDRERIIVIEAFPAR
jgi:hypothetical protein